jgi:thioredoxin reductase
MESLERDGECFVVTTSRGQYRARSVLLAIGRRGSPRKLGVPGEQAAKVVYRLTDAGQYRGQAVLVVGGGDSALEAALAVSEQTDTRVALSYRGSAFSRVKQNNRQRLQELTDAGRIELLLNSEVERIEPDTVVLKTAAGPRRLANDSVIVCVGGELPTALLQRAGIEFATKFGSA